MTKSAIKAIQLLFYILICLTHNFAQANIIRDSEIEEIINVIVQPLREVGSLPDLKVHIIDDMAPNAFTSGGNDIFITSGLIIYYPNPDVLRGIIAHEIGHIIGHHVSRYHEVMQNYSKTTVASMVLGLATAIKGSGDVGLAVMMEGMHYAEQAALAYSRTFESSADQTALKLLEKSGHSSMGLVKFFERSNRLQIASEAGIYAQTHPMNKQRLQVINDHNKHSKYAKHQDKKIYYRYARSAAKLAAFILSLDKISDYIQQQQYPDEIRNYAQAIKCFRAGEFTAALKNINILISRYPSDPFYQELKAQILFEHGQKSALVEYDLALRSRPDDLLMKLGRAIVAISFAKESKDERLLNQSYHDLAAILQREPDNLLAMHYLAIYYEQKGMVGQGYLNAAIMALNSGRKEQAVQMAAAAMKILPKNSPDWYKAGDIIAAAQ